MITSPTENDISRALENLSLLSDSQTNDIDNIVSIDIFEPKIIDAINELRTKKKKRPDLHNIFDHLSRTDSSYIDINSTEHIINDLLKRKIIINKKTSQGLDSFYPFTENSTKSINEDEIQSEKETISNETENVNTGNNRKSNCNEGISLVNNKNISNIDFNVNTRVDDNDLPILVNYQTPITGTKELPITIHTETPISYKADLASKENELTTQKTNTQNKETLTEPNEENGIKTEAKLSALKSFIKCEIAILNDKFEMFRKEVNEKVRMSDNIMKSLEILQQNNSLLQNQLVSKDDMIKSLMDTQMKILEALSEKNTGKNPKDQSSESTMNQHNEKYLDKCERVLNNQIKHPDQCEHLHTNKDKLSQNIDSTPKRLYLGNLNKDVTEDDINDLFGLKSTKYLTQNCSIQMPLNRITGKSRGYAFLTLPSHISKEVIKLDGIEFKNLNIKIEEARTNIQTNPKSNMQNQFRPQTVTNKNPENQHLFGTKHKIVPGEKSYTEATSATSSNEQEQANKVIFFGDSLTNFNRNIKYQINKRIGGNSKFKYFPGASSKDLLHYIDSTLEEQSFNAAVIHVGTNDIINNPDAINNVAENIRSIARKCKKYGINKIFISGLITTTRYLERVRNEANNLVKSICDAEGYFYINNNNIPQSELFKDGLHLLDSGKNILAENFVVNVNNNFLISRTFHPNVNIEATLV